jgi:hypothetical protein
MAVNLSMFAGVGAQLFDNNGIPLAGGLIYTYLAGTNTPAATYTSSTGLIAHSNPIVLDSAGRVATGEIWLTIGLRYKFVVKTSVGVQIASYDNVGSISGGVAIIGNFTGTGVQTNFSLAFAPVDENATQVFINGVYQNKSTYSVAGTNLIFSEAPPLSTKIEVELY